jgi:hypothetical protein
MKLRSTWTDSRLDDFKASVDARFDDLNARIRELTARVDALSNRVDGLQHTMVHGFIAMMVAMVTGFMGIAGLIIAKL